MTVCCLPGDDDDDNDDDDRHRIIIIIIVPGRRPPNLSACLSAWSVCARSLFVRALPYAMPTYRLNDRTD